MFVARHRCLENSRGTLVAVARPTMSALTSGGGGLLSTRKLRLNGPGFLVSGRSSVPPYTQLEHLDFLY